MEKKVIRFWCSKCQDFTIQYIDGPCSVCGTINESYKLSDVPKEKIIEQRKRYKEMQYKQKWGVFNILNPFLRDNNPSYLFSDIVPPKLVVIEDDAGQKEIDEAYKKQSKKELKQEENWKRSS